MKIISAVLKPLRFLLIIFTCTLLILSSTVPAFAANDTTQEGKAAKVYTKKAQDALKDAPQSLKEVENRTQGGLNEVQGKAGAENMKRPSNSQNASSFQDRIENALDRVQHKS